MFYKEKVAACFSEIYTIHKCTLWAGCRIF